MTPPHDSNTRFVVARLVLLWDVGASMWVAAVDSGWRPDQGLGPWVGGYMATEPNEAMAGMLSGQTGAELKNYLARVGYGPRVRS